MDQSMHKTWGTDAIMMCPSQNCTRMQGHTARRQSHAVRTRHLGDYTNHITSYRIMQLYSHICTRKGMEKCTGKYCKEEDFPSLTWLH